MLNPNKTLTICNNNLATAFKQRFFASARRECAKATEYSVAFFSLNVTLGLTIHPVVYFFYKNIKLPDKRKLTLRSR